MENKLSMRTHADMEPVLMDAAAGGPGTFYYMLRGGKELGNVTILEPGNAGSEYIKTLGHYHPYDFLETYHVIEGSGIMLLQKRKIGEDGIPMNDCVEAFRVVHLAAGDALELPLHFGHVLVNVGSGFLITKDDSPSDAATVAVKPHADYAPITAMHGLAYYLVVRNGNPALRKNPHYKEYGVLESAGIPVIA